jgi:hypothetical protein
VPILLRLEIGVFCSPEKHKWSKDLSRFALYFVRRKYQPKWVDCFSGLKPEKSNDAPVKDFKKEVLKRLF